MKLKVLAGAKQGAEIPLKKSKFVIGRASDCTLRAGSEAISRHHCVILRREAGVSIRDLGSRNGTHVNDEKIEAETPLNEGDRVRVGPLEFTFHTGAELAGEKKPKVRDVADALERTAEKSDSATIEEDDISAWLLGPAGGSPTQETQAMKETQTLRMDETHALSQPPGESVEDVAEDGQADASEAEDAEEDKGKGGKKKPGKLPKLPPKPGAKDSREAADMILREMARRR